MADIEKFVYYSNGSKKVLKPTDRIVIGSGGLAFEGDTADDFEIQLSVEDPTADRTITFPDEDGDVALLQGNSLPKALSFPVKNPSNTTALTKGQIVYISGHSGNKPEVSLARSDSSSTMPAFGFVQSDISAEGEGYVVSSGLFKGIDTNTNYAEGDTLYVSSTTAGAFQNTPPTGSSLIQNIGKIIKSDTNNGEVLVGGAGRTNATPNLNQGRFFIGNASNQSVSSSYTLPNTLTNNAILVANSDGTSVLSTDLLTIDTTNDRVGIGTSSPARTLHLVGDVQYEGSMRIDQYHNSTDGPDVLMQKARGTPSSATASQDGDELGKFVFYGHNGTSFLESASFVVTDNGSQGAEIQLKTASTGGTPVERLEINSSGVITFNNSYSFPTSDGTSGQVLTTNGTGTLTFADASGGISNLVEDTTPQLGGTLDLNSQTIQGHLVPSAVDTYNLGSSAAEWNDLYLGDSSNIYFGRDQDITLAHFQNQGLVLKSVLEGSQTPILTLRNDADTSLSFATLLFDSYSASPANNDFIQQITTRGRNSIGSAFEYSKVQTRINNVTDGSEAGLFRIGVGTGGTPAGNTATIALTAYGNSSGDVVVKVDEHDGVSSGLMLGNTLVTATSSEINALDISSETPTDNDVLTYTAANGLHWAAGSNIDLTSVSSNIVPSSADTYNLGSTSGEWANLYLGDLSSIYFGNDQDVILQHNADSGLTLKMGSSQSSYDPAFTVRSSTSNTSGIGPQIKIQKMYTDAGDTVGDIYFQGYLSGAYDNYSRIKSIALAQTHGNLRLSVLSGNIETTAIDIIGDSSSTTPEIVNAGPLAIKIAAADPSTRGDHAHIYSKDVSGSAEMFVQDEAGNVTQISPHNEEGDWIYWSENSKTGKKVKINMEKMIRRLEELTGESFFEEYVEGN